MSKNAIPSKPDNYLSYLLQNLTANYLKQPQFWEKIFGNLADFSLFNSILKNSLKECAKYRSDKGTSLNKVWEEILKDLPKFKQRIGQYIYKTVQEEIHKLPESFLTGSTGFIKTYDAKLLLSEDEINAKYKNLNKHIIREGKFISQDHADLLPATIAVETDKEAREINIELMNLLKDEISGRISTDQREQAISFYEMMIQGYLSWESRGQNNRSFGNQCKEEYKLLLNQINAVKNKIKDLDNLAELKQSIENIQSRNYEGKSFPNFPGIIKKENLQYSPPTNLNLFQYIIPAFGMGWDEDKNMFYQYKMLIEKIDGALISQAFTPEIIDSINKLKESILCFWKSKYQIDFNLFSSDLFIKIYEELNSIDKQKEFFRSISNKYKTSVSGIKIFDINFIPRNKKIEIGITNHIFKGNFSIFVLVNERGRDQEFPWKNEDYNMLPDEIFTLLANAGIWPKTLTVYTKKMDMKIYLDDRWDQEKGILRILKAVLDGSILKNLLDSTVSNKSAEINPFQSLSNEDQIMLIPILSKFKNEGKGKTNLHQYYYEMAETLLILNRIIDNRDFGPLEQFSSSEVCLNHIQEKIIHEVKEAALSTNFIIQMFDNLPSSENISNSMSFWATLSKQQQDVIINKFNDVYSQKFEFTELYEFNFLIEPKKTYKIQATLFEAQNENKKILSYANVVHRILQIGATNTPLRTFVEKSCSKEFSEFNQDIKTFFEDKSTLKTLSRLPGLFVKPGSIFPHFINTSNSVRRNFGLGVQMNLEKDTIQNERLFIVSIEGTTLNREVEPSLQRRVFRISIYLYSLIDKVKVIFDEFFYQSPAQEKDYDMIIENTVIQACYRTGIPVLIRAKSKSKSGQWIQENAEIAQEQKNALVNNETWRDFIRYSQTKSRGTEQNLVVGFIKDYVPIPQLKLKPRKSDIRVLNLDFTSQFRQGDEIQEFNSNISLILKGTDQDEANILYSHASALLTFSPKGKDLSSDEKKKIFDLLLLGASIGDERGELGLTSLDRLFVFPYSDINRRIYGPALLLYGLEAISYDKREQY